MEKARSLVEAEANLDDLDEGFPESQAAQDAVSQSNQVDAGSRVPGGAGHPSGFAPASATQSGFSPVGMGRGEPSGLHPRSVSATESGVFSGVPGGAVSGDRLVDSLQSALGAASRNEAGLGSLQRAIRDASRAFTASRHAQEALTEDLRVMYRGLNELMSEKAAVERYSALLTQERDAALDAAEEARREAKREREFLIREQDRFIQLLLEEHEAELLQIRRGLSSQKPVAEAPLATVPGLAPPPSPSLAALPVEPGLSAAGERRRAGDEQEDVSAPRLSGAALARQALANAAGSEAARVVPLPDGSTEARAEDEKLEERPATYPPPPAVLDLDALAAEVDGNSERPPPIRRVGSAEPKIHLKPARVPTQLFDTLVSPIGEPDTKRKG